jgi:lysozyme
MPFFQAGIREAGSQPCGHRRAAGEPEGRLAAIVDFTFNLGAGRLQTSTLRRRVNQRDWAAAAKELHRWVYGGGKVLPGLVKRRMAEVALFI